MQFYAALAHQIFFVGMLQVKCPICGTRAPYEGNEYRPFCSERCRLLDFGAWVNEEYTLPVEETNMTEEDIAAIERAQRAANGNE